MFSSFACFELCRRGSSKRYRLGHEKPHNHNVLVSAILKLAQAQFYGHLKKLLVSLVVGFSTLGLNNWPRKRAFNVVVFLTRIAFPNIYLGDKIGVMAIRFTGLLNKSQITTAGFQVLISKDVPISMGSRWNATVVDDVIVFSKAQCLGIFF